MRIGDVMTTEVPSVDPCETVCDAAREMTQAGVKAIPVCDHGRLEGIITDWDVTRALANDPNAGRRPLGDYMSTDVVAAAPDARLDEASELMADKRIHHLLVCDGDRFAGMVHLDVEWSRLGGLEAPMASFSAPI
jgi:CBS domain-containing protein